MAKMCSIGRELDGHPALDLVVGPSPDMFRDRETTGEDATVSLKSPARITGQGRRESQALMLANIT